MGNSQAVLRSQLTISFPSEPPTSEPLGLTFRDSKRSAYHRWYPYVQGFSYGYVRSILNQFGPATHVYNPFGGSGTTQLEPSSLGTKSTYSEINPFMRFVAETKINSSIWARANLAAFKKLATEYLKQLTPNNLKHLGQRTSLESYTKAFKGRDFFEESHLRELLSARDLAVEIAN